jgi:hypothetical protein
VGRGFDRQLPDRGPRSEPRSNSGAGCTDNLDVNQVGHDNLFNLDLKYTNSAIINVVQTGTGTGPTNTLNLNVCCGITPPTLISHQNGQVTGSLTIPQQIVETTNGSECVKASWTSITLTITGTNLPVGGLTVNVPDVSPITYDSTGSFCSS